MGDREFRKSFLIGILLATSFSLMAQTPFLRHISLLKGKEDYNVNCIYQEPNGWIWFGTDKGLFRYDGINLNQYTVSDSLAGSNVTALFSAQDGTLWIGHQNGKISHLVNDNIQKFSPESGLGTVPITDILSDNQGNIWYSTMGEGIFCYNGRYLSNKNTDDGLSDNYVYDIEFDRTGTMWLATDYGITAFNNDSSTKISMKDGIPDNIVRVIKADGNNKLWMGSEEAGITILNLEDHSLHTFEGWEFGAITGIEIDADNELWVSTRSQGIIRVNFNTELCEASYRQLTTDHGLASNRLNFVVKDYENNIWIAGKKGITQVLPPVFEYINKSTGTPFEMVYSFTTDHQNNYWVCSEAGLFKGIVGDYGEINWKEIRLSNKAEELNFISVYTDIEGNIWVGTYGSGVFSLDPSGRLIKQFTRRDGLSDENVIHIAGADKKICFSTLGGGVCLLDIDEKKMEAPENEYLDNTYVYASQEDPEDRIWIAGTLKSPAYIKNDEVHFIHTDLNTYPQLYGIAIDSSGNAWFNASDKGILEIRNDSIIVLGAPEGISFPEIQSIVFDKRGNLLIITNLGFTFYKPGTGIFRQYGDNTGLSYLYPMLNAVHTDPSGRIWIGTENGLIIYNPDYLDIGAIQPRIFLSGLELFGVPVNRDRSKYRYNQRNFTFSYTGIWFSNPEAVQYRYMLEGYDPQWIHSHSPQTLNYPKLMPARYRFVAEVSIDGHNWIGSDDNTYEFIIKPPFWQRIWFIAGMTVLIIVGILVYIRQRLKNLQRAKDELEKEVFKRTEEIRSQNEELEAQKEEIAAQRDMAERQRDQIELQKEEIQASIRYAHRIQTAALPPRIYMENILKNHFVLNKPKDIVSGDFYWTAQRNDHIFFAVADCTGHGVPGAFMSMLGLTALNDIVKSLDTCKAGRVLDILSERIRESLHNRTGEEITSRDGMDISLCILNPETKKLQFAAAHNDLYIMRRGEMQIIKADNMGIGSDIPEGFHFLNNEIDLVPGDLLYLFSDGFPDQFGGPECKKYKYGNFRNFLKKIHGEDIPRQKWLLDEEIEA